MFRWVQHFTPQLTDAARPCRNQAGERWFAGETYVKIAGVWRYVYRAVDQHGQVIDVYVSRHRDIASARRFFTTALTAHPSPAQVITDKAPALANVIGELIPTAFHNTGQHQNNRCEADHGRLKARLRPMRGLTTDRTAIVVTVATRTSGTCAVPRRARCRSRAHVPLGDRSRRTPTRDLSDSPSAHDPPRPTIAKRNSARRHLATHVPGRRPALSRR